MSSTESPQPPETRGLDSAINIIKQKFQQRCEFHHQLKEAVNNSEPQIAEIQSLCLAWLLTDQERRGYENALRVLIPKQAAKLIQAAHIQARKDAQCNS